MIRSIRYIFISLSLLAYSVSHATTVQFQTVLGEFEVALFDETVPITVTNFLDYVDSESYENSIVHRSAPNFVIQGGGFHLIEDELLSPIETRDPILNEALYTNVRGTIAMAKLESNENSATSQWFINLQDNSENLDFQNGGFTVFGRVIGEGMRVVDAIAAVNTLNFDVLPNLPLRDYTENDAINGVAITAENYVIVHDIVVTDGAVDSGAQLTPDEIVQPTPTPGPSSGSDTVEGVGSFDWLFISALILLLGLHCGWGRYGRGVLSP